MSKLIFSILISLVFLLNTYSQTILSETDVELRSPDGKYVFRFYQRQLPDDSKQMYYTLSFNGKTVVEESELGVLIDNRLFESALGISNDSCKIWGENLSLTGEERKMSDQAWQPVYGERSRVRDHYSELILRFQKGGDGRENPDNEGYDKKQYYYMNLIVRAYNEGVAFRYHFPEATNGLFLHIVGEQTQFTLPAGTMAYYERWAQGPYSLLPLEGWTDECERPLTMKLENGLTVALSEAQMVDYVRMKFRLCEIKENTLQASLYAPVDVITPYSTPWRVVMAAEKAVDLIRNNDLILNLNDTNRIEDTSWIRPGKAIRVAKLTQADAMGCVDFAAKRGLQYIHIDAGWYGPEVRMASDASTVAQNRDLDIPALTEYAAGKGIGVWVYVNQRALVQQLDEILPLYRKWGIKGIKFGFVQIGSQRWSTWMHDAVRKCAEYEIMVDIHDEYRPTGFSRTYPNLLTQEGIRGNEEMPNATHNTILPFTRFLAGAGDYTICYYNNRIKTTHAHQLAMSVVYYSPLQFLYWYDHPTDYREEPEIEFFDRVKTVWDDTKVIDGEIGDFISMARRSGEDWFFGTIGNMETRSVVTSLDFLDVGRLYVASIYTDDEHTATRTKVRVSHVLTDSKTVLRFRLRPSGGCAVHFTPATKEDLKKYKMHKGRQEL